MAKYLALRNLAVVGGGLLLSGCGMGTTFGSFEGNNTRIKGPEDLKAIPTVGPKAVQVFGDGSYRCDMFEYNKQSTCIDRRTGTALTNADNEGAPGAQLAHDIAGIPTALAGGAASALLQSVIPQRNSTQSPVVVNTGVAIVTAIAERDVQARAPAHRALVQALA